MHEPPNDCVLPPAFQTFSMKRTKNESVLTIDNEFVALQ